MTEESVQRGRRRGIVPRAAALIGGEFRAQSLSLTELPRGIRLVSGGAVAGLVIALVFLAPNLLAGWWPAPVVRVPGRLLADSVPGRLSVPAFVLAMLLLGVAAGTLAGAATQRAAASRRAVMALLGLLGVTIGSALYDTGRVADVAFSGLAPGILRILGGAGIGAGILLALAPGRLGRSPIAAALLAATPFAAALLATGLLASQHGTIQFGAADPTWPRTIEGVAIAAGSLSSVVTLAGGMVGVLFLWQSAVAARGVRRQLGAATASRAAGRPPFLATVLGAKVTWLFAGYTGLLPQVLAGGSADAWVRARAEDPAGLAFAITLVLVASWWMLRGARPRIPDSGVPAAAAFFALGFNLPFLVAGLMLGLMPVLALASSALAPTLPPGINLADCLQLVGGSLVGADACAASAVEGLIRYAGLATWISAAVIATILFRSRRSVPVAVGLAATVLWSAPSAASVALDLLGRSPTAVIGRPELLTVDALLTGAVTLLAVLWWTGRQRSISPRSLALVVIVSTLVAHSGALIPSAAQPLVFGLLIVVPPIYELLFESDRVNKAGDRRGELVPRTLGLQLLGLGLLLTSIAFDGLSPSTANLADLFVPPIAAILVAAEVCRRERRRSLPTQPRPMLRPAVRWAAAGALVIFACAGALTPVRMPAVPNAEARQYGEFLDHVDVARATVPMAMSELLSAASGNAAGLEAAFQRFSDEVDAAGGWLAGHRAAPCYVSEFTAWSAVVQAMTAARDSLLSGENLEATITAYVAAASAFDPGLAACQTLDGAAAP